MWAALWVTQRDWADQPKLHESARRTIHECLDREVGSLAGGTRGAALLNAVRSDIASLRNGVQKPTGRYKDALTDLERAVSQFEELERKQGTCLRTSRNSPPSNGALAQAASSGEDARLEADLAEAKQKKEAAQRYEDQEQRADADYKLAQSRLSDVEKTAERRENLRRQMEEAGRRVAPAITAAGESKNIREAAANALPPRTNAFDPRKLARDAAAQKVREARVLADLARQSEALELLRAPLARGQSAQQSVNALGARLLAAPISGEQVKAIEEATVSLDKQRAVLEAQATLVTLNIHEDAKARLRVNGAANGARRSSASSRILCWKLKASAESRFVRASKIAKSS